MQSELTAFDRFNALVDWFIPQHMRDDRVQRKQARLFLVSHLCGPFIGNTVPAALYVLDPHPGYQTAVLAGSILLFWVFPFLLKWNFDYNVISILSIENLMFCINFGNLFCGGISSPTLPWFLTIPLLMFFYFGSRYWVRVVFILMFLANLAVFYAFARTGTFEQTHISPSALQYLGVISTTAAAMYVAMMALFYAKALASHTELEAEMRNHAQVARELGSSVEAAERTGAMRAEFLNRIDTQSRAPLATIIGYSDILLYDEPSEAARLELALVRNAGSQILRLVNDVLDLAKIEAGQMEIYSETFDPADLLRALTAEMAPGATAGNNWLELAIEEDLGLISTDMRKVRIVLIQLVSNAVKFTTNGTIRIEAHREMGPASTMLVVSVRDDGCGIDEADLPTLFERFALNDDATAHRYGGTGLGLALSRKLCVLLGGDISVSTKAGRGSCFTVRIPSDAQHGDAADLPGSLVGTWPQPTPAQPLGGLPVEWRDVA